MAIPIKETPVLKGKNAREFDHDIIANETRKVSSADFNRAQETYNKLNEASRRFA
jgi:hypothetical protein